MATANRIELITKVGGKFRGNIDQID